MGCSTTNRGALAVARRTTVALCLVVLLMLVGVTNAYAANMDVVVWGQGDSRWTSVPLGQGGFTLGQAGCAVTSVSMLANYYGSAKDPGQICEWLNSNGGFQDGTGYVYWGSIPAAAGGTISYVGKFDYPNQPADMNTINAELDAGNPVVTALNGYGHYVLITGHDGDTYYINDPGGPTLPGARTTFNARYGAPVANYIDGILIYHGTHAAPVQPATLSVTGPITLSAGPYYAGQTITGSFTVKNTGGESGIWAPLVLGFRGPSGENRDAVAATSITLTPGQSQTVSFSKTVDLPGNWTGFVSGLTGGSAWQSPTGATVTFDVLPHVRVWFDSIQPSPAIHGRPVTFSGHAIDTHGHPIIAYQWRSSISGVISSSRTFTTSSLPVGTHTIYLKARCSDGTWSPEVSTTWRVRDDDVDAWFDSIQPSPAIHGQPVTFSGHATDSLGHAATLYEWRSSISGWLSSSRTFTTSRLPVGTHTIYFSARCANGTWSPRVSTTVWVTPPPGATPTVLALTSPSTCSYSKATLSASLRTSTGALLPGRTVSLQRSSDRVHWSGLAGVSSGTGIFRMPVSPTSAMSYRLVFEGDATHAATTSHVVKVTPKARLIRSTSWTSLTRAKTYYAWGYIAPRHATGEANKVKICAYKKRSDGTYHYVKSFTAKYSYYSTAKTRYRAAVKLTSRGKWKLVAYHAADTKNAKTYGSSDIVTVK